MKFVCVLKLIWRILSAKGSLWVDWVKRYLIRGSSIWTVRENSTRGSWMWTKILKYRNMAKPFHRVEIKNGEATSFWFDSWSSLGCLHDAVGDGGYIDLGIPKHSTVREVLSMTRRRKHRQTLLNQIEEEVRNTKHKQALSQLDVALWRGRNANYKKTFITNETWWQLKPERQLMEGHKEIWFPFATPRYAFMTWLVVKNRVETGERMARWKQNADTSCVFCQEPMETREHLFFSCSYSKTVWRDLTKGLLLEKYSEQWSDVLELLTGSGFDKTSSFILRYVFQNTIHSIWRERNERRHGQQPNRMEMLVKMIDKNVRNRLCTIAAGGNSHYADGVQVWFASRQQSQLG